MLPPRAELPTRSNEPEAKPKQLDREAIIAPRLSLFRSLFRGRKDVYAKRWVSKDGNASGTSLYGKHPLLRLVYLSVARMEKWMLAPSLSNFSKLG